MTSSIQLDLRVRLVLLLVLAFLILFLIPVWHFVEEREQKLQSATIQLVDKVKLVAARQAYLVHRGEAILNSLTDKPELGLHAGRERCQQYLATRLRQNPDFSQMTKVLPNGEVACAAVPPDSYLNLSDRPYFQRTLKSRGMMISEVVNGQILNKPIIIFSKVVRNPQDEVSSVLLLALGLNWMEMKDAASDLPEGSRISVLDDTGRVVMRYPDPEAWSGKSAALSPAIQQLLHEPAEGVFENVTLDGTAKLFAHAPLFGSAAGNRYQLLVSLPKATIEEPIRREALMALGVMLAVLVGTIAAVLLGGHYLLMRPLLLLTGAAARFKSGDLSARSGLPHGKDTLGRLAEVLDQSAEAIAARDQQLQASEARYRTLVEMSPDAVVVHRNGQIIYANPAAITLFAAANGATLIGRNVMDFIDPQFRGIASARFQTITQVGDKVPRIRELLHKLDGSAIHVEVQSVGILYHDAPAIQIQIYDLTERLRREEELLRLRLEMQSMMEWQVARHTVAALAHEFNQPLASLAALSEATRRMVMEAEPGHSNPGRQPKLLEEALIHIGVEAERAGQVLRNLLLSVHRPETTLEPVELSDLLHAARQDFLLNCGSDCTIFVQCADQLPRLLLNRLQMSKVLQNLITNSAQAMRQADVIQGRIWLSAELDTDSQQVRLGVLDEGPGIGPHFARQIFHPMVSTKSDGLGMGLAICRTLVELHGGQLCYDTQNPRGARFIVTLPITTPNA